MDGSSRAFGVGPTVRLCGKDYSVRAKTIEHYAEVEAEIRKRRGDPASMLAGRAVEFSKLNTGPFFDKLMSSLAETAAAESWPTETTQRVAEFLRNARERLDTTSQYEDLLRRAFDEARDWSVVTLWDIHKFLDETWQGQCMKVWFAIRHNDPALTLERVTKLFYDELLARTKAGGEEAAIAFRREVEQAIAIAEGSDPLGN